MDISCPGLAKPDMRARGLQGVSDQKELEYCFKVSQAFLCKVYSIIDVEWIRMSIQGRSGTTRPGM